MANILRSGLWTAGVSIVLVGGALITISILSSGVAADRARMEALSLARAAQTVSGKKLPHSWSAGAYISEDAVNRIVQGLVGVKVTNDPVNGDGEDTEIVVNAFNVGFSPGFASGAISLSADSKKRNLAVNLSGEASLTFGGVVQKTDKDGKQKSFAQFAVTLIKVEPNISWSGLRARFFGYAGELIKTGLAASLAKNLKVEIPITSTVGFDLKMDRNSNVPVRDPKTDNYVVIQLSMPSKVIERGLSYDAPVFTSHGLWLLANAVEPGKQASPPVPSDKDPTPPATQTASDRKVLSALAPPEGNPDVLLWLRSDLITSLVDQLQSLPDANRTVTAHSVDFKGRLSDSSNAFAELTGKDAVNGSATLASLASAWSDDKGLTISGHLTADAQAKVHVHFDPGIGGGIGTSIGLLGKAEIAARASVKTEVASVDNHKLVLIHPEVECQPAVISMKADGKLSVPGIFKTDVPSIGGVFKGPLGAQAIPPMLAFSDVPFPVRGASSDDGGPMKVDANGKHYLITAPWRYAAVAFEPVSSQLTAAGISVSAKLKVAFSQSKTEEDRDKTEAALLAKAIGSNQFKACAEELSFAVTLGPFEFGPNGVITQIIKAFVDVNKTLDKAGQDTIATLNKAAGDAGNAVDKAGKDTVNTVKKAGSDTVNTLNKARDDTKRFLGIH